jgi:hypothetical protein
MADRPFLAPSQVVAPVAGNMATTITSAPTVLKNLTVASYEIDWASGSTPVGTIALQVSNTYALNPNGSVLNAGTWNTAFFFNPATGTYVNSVAVTGNSGTGTIELESGTYATRVVYTAASGSGTMTVTFVGKVM